MEKLVFYACRNDGLGERLRAILNAIALSRVYDTKYKFTWRSNLAGSEFHTTETAEKIFSPSFLETHCIDPKEVGEIKNVSYFLETKHPGHYFCDQTIPDRSFTENKSDYALYKAELKNAFFHIDFSDSFKKSIQEAKKIEIDDSTIALHLRAGDLIYDRYKHNISYLGKAIPFPVAEKIIEKSKADGFKVLIFGQDKVLGSYLKNKWDVELSNDLIPSSLDKAEASIFDVILMSRCRKIYAGNSGFSILSSIISDGEYIHYFDFLNSEERAHLMYNYFLDMPYNDGIPKLQIAYACKAALLDGFKIFSEKDFKEIVMIGKESDENSVFFDFISAWKEYLNGDFEEGDKILSKFFEAEKSKLIDFIKNNIGTPHQRKIFNSFFNFEIIKDREKSTASGKLQLMMKNFLINK